MNAAVKLCENGSCHTYSYSIAGYRRKGIKYGSTEKESGKDRKFLVEKYELKHTYARIRKKWKVVPAYNSSIRAGMNQSIDAVSVLETAVEYTSVSEPQKHP